MTSEAKLHSIGIVTSFYAVRRMTCISKYIICEFEIADMRRAGLTLVEILLVEQKVSGK
jgi:hypothetical protein